MRRTTLTSLYSSLAVAGACCALAAPAQAAKPAKPAVAVTQALAILLQDHVARTAPDQSAHVIESVAGTTPLTKVRTTLPVIGTRKNKDGNRWVHVRLPGRPTGHTGWILADQTITSSTEWHVAIELAARQVVVYRDGVAVRTFPAVVGKPSTPTPRGQFFVEESESISVNAAGGPFALALSARSGVFQEFEGGPGQIAIHGTDHLSDPLGSAASHGCVRVSPAAITWMSKRIGGGVPVTVSS
ncbi:MAG TPA: L,D-transpeptidase [Gaiellales bacterium]|jgi:lipoprotein-anchoring transpeptidase ErfK/SrfK|nr:L,D-transpeptidase [Gaiellales bacterium]